MWTKDSLPPVGYNLYASIKCPECGHNVYFDPGHRVVSNGEQRSCYCPNPECAIAGVHYWIGLSASECRVIEYV